MSNDFDEDKVAPGPASLVVNPLTGMTEPKPEAGDTGGTGITANTSGTIAEQIAMNTGKEEAQAEKPAKVEPSKAEPAAPVLPEPPAKPSGADKIREMLRLSVELERCAGVAGITGETELPECITKCNDMLKDMYIKPELNRLVMDNPQILAELFLPAPPAPVSAGQAPGPLYKRPSPFTSETNANRVAVEAKDTKKAESIAPKGTDHMAELMRELREG